MDQHAVNYFKKQAKQLLHLVQNGDAPALARFKQHDAADSPTLMRAQHVLANEAGFRSWKSLLAASDPERQLAALMHDLPLLCDHGIGVFDVPRRTREERTRLLAENRKMLRQSVADVQRTIAWLQANIARIKTVNSSANSYGLKHCAERDIGYITNGVFIAAAIIGGYGYRLLTGSANVNFAMSKRSIDAVYDRQNRRKRQA